MNEELKKGNLIFLKTSLADLIYIIRSVEGEVVVGKKLDSPPSQWENLSLSQVVKIAEEQERLFPTDLMGVIEKQRLIVFTPAKKKKKKSFDSLMKGLTKETMEEILGVLAEAGITEEGGESE